MKRLSLFVRNNSIVLICTVIGVSLGYAYWLNWGIYYGTFPLSSVCWVNCTYGGLFGGLVGSFLNPRRVNR